MSNIDVMCEKQVIAAAKARRNLQLATKVFGPRRTFLKR